LLAKVRHAERRCPHERRVRVHVGATRRKVCARVAVTSGCRSKVRPTTSVARGAAVPVCLGRPGGRLAGGWGWLGQRLHQRLDLGVGVASVATQGTEVGQPALLCPAAHRLWRHMEELVAMKQ
jgi:hypothetical protein